MTYKEYCLTNFNYEVKTTFFDDFSIADRFGAAAIKNTYKRAFNEWKNNYVYITELCMVLNHKCWMWYDKNETISELYGDLYYKCRDWCLDNLKGEELTYFLETTD